MDLFNGICQGLGLALAIGIGGGLVALFAAAMASLEAGFDPDGTDFSFITENWFLVTLLVLVVLTVLALVPFNGQALLVCAVLIAADVFAFRRPASDWLRTTELARARTRV